MEAVGNVKIISNADPEAVKDVLRDGKRRYQLKYLSFLRAQSMKHLNEKLKYMTQNEINRLSSLISTIDLMKNKDLLKEKNVNIAGWLINLSNSLDKCGEYEKANTLDAAVKILVQADKIDNDINVVDLVLTAVRELGSTNTKKLKDFLLTLSPFQISDSESAIFSEDEPEENQADLMLAWQILDKAISEPTDDVEIERVKKKPTPVVPITDDIDVRYPSWTTKFNQRAFNLLYVTAGTLDENGKRTEATKLDLALSVLIRLRDELSQQ